MGKFLLEARLRRVCELALGAGARPAGEPKMPRDVVEARAAALLRLGEVYEETMDGIRKEEKCAKEAATAPLLRSMKSQMQHQRPGAEGGKPADGK
jgi:hypothetical protein